MLVLFFLLFANHGLQLFYHFSAKCPFCARLYALIGQSVRFIAHNGTKKILKVHTNLLTSKTFVCNKIRDPTRDGWIKEFIKKEMKFWAVLGSWGCREKNLPTAISMQLFGVVFPTFCGQNFFSFFF